MVLSNPSPAQLSIIIVNWNTEELLRACLSSIRARGDRLSIEVIVVDNGSADGSCAMVQRDFPDVVLIANAQNRGFAAANNQAMAIAKGRYLLLLNSDTVVHDAVLERSVAYMDEHAEVGVMGCRVLNSDGTLQPTCSQHPSLVNLMLLTSGLWKLPWPPIFDRYQMRRWRRTEERDVEVVSGCYMLVRAAALREVGPLDESFFFFGEETDWCRRFRNAGWKIRFAPVGEITHHGGGSSRSLSFERDLMLSSAMVRLHLKHSGKLAAWGAWGIVLGFNLSRAVVWTVASLVSKSTRSCGRRDHFLSLVRHHREVWPSVRTSRP
jgi:GT2 family glycosyltransferase